MVKFNYIINYKDAITGQDIEPPLRVGYDLYDTLISETQKTFPGYTARPVYGYDKTTPTEKEYQDSLSQEYRKKVHDYALALERSKKNEEILNSIRNDPDYFETRGVAILEKYRSWATGSFDYFNDIKVFTDIQGVETLARPISWGNQGFNSKNKFNYSGQAGSLGRLRRNSSFFLRDVARTTSGKTVNLTITVTDFSETSVSNPIPGIWIAPYNGDAIGIWLYDVYRAELRLDFTDENGSPIILAQSTAVADIDYYQQFRAMFSHSNPIMARPPGSGLNFSQGYLGDSGQILEGARDIPRGSFMLAGVGSSMLLDVLGNSPGYTTIFNTSRKEHDSFEIVLFGSASRGEVLDFSVPPKPELPETTREITVLYDKIAEIRPWAVRNSGQWKSFATKNIHMVRRIDGAFARFSTTVYEQDVGKPFTRLDGTGRYLSSYSLSGQGIRKSGVWKQQGRTGS